MSNADDTVDFFVVAGDTLPSIVGQCADQVGPVDLSAALGVEFVMVERDSKNVVVDYAAVNAVDLATGRIRYDWQPADVANQGFYLGRFRARFTDGQVSFPRPDYLLIQISDNPD